MEKDAVAEREVGSFRQSRCSGCLRRLPFPIHARSLATTRLPDSRLKPFAVAVCLAFGFDFQLPTYQPGVPSTGVPKYAPILRILGWQCARFGFARDGVEVTQLPNLWESSTPSPWLNAD